MRIVKIKFKEDNGVDIYLDNVNKLEIPADKNKDLKAEDIFNVFDYKVGEEYKVENEGINDNNKKWATPFFDLIKQIGDKINAIEVKDNNTKDINLEDDKSEKK